MHVWSYSTQDVQVSQFYVLPMCVRCDNDDELSNLWCLGWR